jgi:hypothetical protein
VGALDGDVTLFNSRGVSAAKSVIKRWWVKDTSDASIKPARDAFCGELLQKEAAYKEQLRKSLEKHGVTLTLFTNVKDEKNTVEKHTLELWRSRSSFTGAITGNTLAVESVEHGLLFRGMTVWPGGAVITALLSGKGGAGTYTVDGCVAQDVPDTQLVGSSSPASFTGLGSISGTTLTVSAVAGVGTLAVGSLVVGAGVAPGTFVTAFRGTSAGGVGTYTVGVAQEVPDTPLVGCSPPASFTGRGSISGTMLTVSAVTGAGALAVGSLVAGAGVAPGTFVTAFRGTSAGGVGTYTVGAALGIVPCGTPMFAHWTREDAKVANFARVRAEVEANNRARRAGLPELPSLMAPADYFVEGKLVPGCHAWMLRVALPLVLPVRDRLARILSTALKNGDHRDWVTVAGGNLNDLHATERTAMARAAEGGDYSIMDPLLLCKLLEHGPGTGSFGWTTWLKGVTVDVSKAPWNADLRRSCGFMDGLSKTAVEVVRQLRNAFFGHTRSPAEYSKDLMEAAGDALKGAFDAISEACAKQAGNYACTASETADAKRVFDGRALADPSEENATFKLLLEQNHKALTGELDYRFNHLYGRLAAMEARLSAQAVPCGGPTTPWAAFKSAHPEWSSVSVPFPKPSSFFQPTYVDPGNCAGLHAKFWPPSAPSAGSSDTSGGGGASSDSDPGGGGSMASFEALRAADAAGGGGGPPLLDFAPPAPPAGRLAAGRVVALCGLGGVGKTTLAQRYATEAHADYPGGVFWFTAGQLDIGVDRAVCGTLQRSDLKERCRGDKEGALGHWLRAVNAHGLQSLVIVDNADTPDALNETLKFLHSVDVVSSGRLAATSGHVLLTSRMDHFALEEMCIDSVTVLGLPQESAVELLLRHLRVAGSPEGAASEVCGEGSEHYSCFSTFLSRASTCNHSPADEARAVLELAEKCEYLPLFLVAAAKCMSKQDLCPSDLLKKLSQFPRVKDPDDPGRASWDIGARLLDTAVGSLPADGLARLALLSLALAAPADVPALDLLRGAERSVPEVFGGLLGGISAGGPLPAEEGSPLVGGPRAALADAVTELANLGLLQATATPGHWRMHRLLRLSVMAHPELGGNVAAKRRAARVLLFGVAECTWNPFALRFEEDPSAAPTNVWVPHARVFCCAGSSAYQAAGAFEFCAEGGSLGPLQMLSSAPVSAVAAWAAAAGMAAAAAAALLWKRKLPTISAGVLVAAATAASALEVRRRRVLSFKARCAIAHCAFISQHGDAAAARKHIIHANEDEALVEFSRPLTRAILAHLRSGFGAGSDGGGAGDCANGNTPSLSQDEKEWGARALFAMSFGKQHGRMVAAVALPKAGAASVLGLLIGASPGDTLISTTLTALNTLLIIHAFNEGAAAETAQAVVSALTTHAGVAILCERSCLVLTTITSSDAGMVACVEMGAPLKVVTALNTHAGVAGVCKYGCEVLSNIAGSDSGRAACVEAGAPQAVVAALTNHAGVADVCNHGCWALSKIAISDAGRVACVDAGAPLAVVATALKTRAGTADVCEIGCLALMNFACSDTGRAACVEAGAPRAVVAALTTHAGVADLCNKGCCALSVIACSDTGRAACVEAGAPQAVVAALKTHAGVADVCNHGCWALSKIAISDAGRVACIDAGAPLAVATALNTHAGTADVCENGCLALMNIACSDTGRAACVEAGAPQAVVAALTRHAGVADLCNIGCCALSVIACSDTGRAACVKAGAPHAVVAALTNHAGVAYVCNEGCGALNNIAYSETGRAACVEAGAPRAVVAALTTHGGVANVCKNGCWALSRIASSDPGRAACVEAGAPRAVVAALTTHAGVVDVCKPSFFALSGLAAIDAGKAACVDAGAPLAVLIALNTHTGVADLRELGCITVVMILR